jgi:hypothetical protein
MNELQLLRDFRGGTLEPSNDAWAKARAAIAASQLDAADDTPPNRRVRLPRARRQGGRPIALLGATAGVGGALAAALVLTASSAPTVAFAGWSAAPTAHASGEVHAAESECQRNARLASAPPTLVDTRGPYTLLIYGSDSGGLCITGPSLLSPSGEPPAVPFGFGGTTTTAPVAPKAIQRTLTGGLTAKSGDEFTFNVGRVGEGVTAVTIILQDGSRVAATTSNGWFAAWWPGGQAAQAADLTTTEGAAVQSLMPSAAPTK